MGINWEGALAGLGGSVSQLAGLAITAQVQAQRDQNMARYQQQSQQAGFAHDTQMQDTNLQAQGIVAERKIVADQAAATQKREQEVADATLAHQRGQDDIRLRGRADPSGTVVNTNIGAGDNEFTKALDKTDAETFTKLREAATSAGKTEATLNVIEEIGTNTATGVTPEVLAKIGSIFGSQAGASMQAYQAAVTPLILDQTSKLSGVISDKDMEVIKSSMPSFATDPRANKIILGIIRKGMQDAQTLYAEANDYLEASENYSLRGWVPSLAVGGRMSEKAKENLNAAENPTDVLSGFGAWKKEQGR